MDLRETSTKDAKFQSKEDYYSKYPEIIQDTLSSEKLIYEDTSTELTEMNPTGDSSSRSPANITLPTIVVDDVDENDDDPPPYTAIIPPNHVGWPFDFPSNIPYSVHTTASYRTEVPLAPFQSSLTSGSNFYPEGSNGQHTSITVPLMPYPIFKYGSHRSLFMQGTTLPFTTDNNSTTKSISVKTRRYGVIIIAAVVIVFLMALSLMVRLVIDKNLWRG